jgi:hypothetical protein
MLATQPAERTPRLRVVRCLIAAGLFLIVLVACGLGARRYESLQLAAAEADEQATCEQRASTEYGAGQKALAEGRREDAARHFLESGRWGAQADRHMREQDRRRRFWW